MPVTAECSLCRLELNQFIFIFIFGSSSSGGISGGISGGGGGGGSSSSIRILNSILNIRI